MKPLTPTAPHVIIMVGIPGAGKTTFAEHFAKTFHAPYINPRDIISQTGIDGDAAVKVTKVLLDELLKTNRTLMYEGATDTKLQRQAVIQEVTKAGYKTLLVWVQTESAEAKRRATKPQKNVVTLSEAGFDESIRRFQPPLAVESPVVISGKHTYATQLKVVLKNLAIARPDTPPIIPPRPSAGRSIIIR